MEKVKPHSGKEVTRERAIPRSIKNIMFWVMLAVGGVSSGCVTSTISSLPKGLQASSKNGKCGWDWDQWWKVMEKYAASFDDEQAAHTTGDPKEGLPDECVQKPTCLQVLQCLDEKKKKRDLKGTMDDIGKMLSGDDSVDE